MSAIDSDALKEYIKKTDLTAVERGALLQAISNMPTLTPPNEPLTIEQLRESPHGKIKNSTLQSICNRANEIASRPPEVSP